MGGNKMTKTQKLLSAGVFCCLMAAPSMFATSINGGCGTELFNGSGTLVVGTDPTPCPTATTLGLTVGTLAGQATITGIELWVSADFTGGTQATNGVQVVFTPSATSGSFTTVAVTCTAVGTPGASNYTGGNNCGLYSGSLQAPGTFKDTYISLSTSQLQTIATTTNAIHTSEVGTVTQGGVTGFSGISIIEYDYTINGSSVPEPTAFVLMGAGLGLIGMLRRKTFRR
jgi:PEP-CTERM motif